jgi:hypothetical protein
MEMLFYIALAALLYGVIAERADREVEREMRNRRKQPPDLRLVEGAGPVRELRTPPRA